MCEATEKPWINGIGVIYALTGGWPFSNKICNMLRGRQTHLPSFHHREMMTTLATHAGEVRTPLQSTQKHRGRKSCCWYIGVLIVNFLRSCYFSLTTFMPQPPCTTAPDPSDVIMTDICVKCAHTSFPFPPDTTFLFFGLHFLPHSFAYQDGIDLIPLSLLSSLFIIAPGWWATVATNLSLTPVIFSLHFLHQKSMLSISSISFF